MGLGRSRLLARLLVLGAAGTLGSALAFATIHPAVVVGIGAAIGMLALPLAVALVIPMALLALGGLGLPRLSVSGMSLVLGMASGGLSMASGVLARLMLARRGRGRLGRLSECRRDKGERRGGRDEYGLHDHDLLKERLGALGRAQSIRGFAEAVGQPADSGPSRAE